MSIYRTLKDYVYNRLTATDRIEQKIDDLINLIGATHDITNAPRAHGALRLSQMANATLLKRVTDVLEENNISYWLEYGTLLGAIRHKGSIPWDDDIDIGVLRSSYNNLSALLQRTFATTNDIDIVQSDALRIMTKNAPCQVDIFPFDVYNVHAFSPECKRTVLQARKKACSLFKYDFNRIFQKQRSIINLSNSDIETIAKSLTAPFTGPHKLLVVGPEAPVRRLWAFNYDWLFPLSTVEYEGMRFKAPNRPDLFLMASYGDYMAPPKGIQIHSDIAQRMTVDVYEALRDKFQSSSPNTSYTGLN